MHLTTCCLPLLQLSVGSLQAAAAVAASRCHCRCCCFRSAAASAAAAAAAATAAAATCVAVVEKASSNEYFDEPVAVSSVTAGARRPTRPRAAHRGRVISPHTDRPAFITEQHPLHPAVPSRRTRIISIWRQWRTGQPRGQYPFRLAALLWDSAWIISSNSRAFPF